MERWLTKPRVMAALCIVMLSAALNRKDPLIYGLFLFLITLCAFGFALPWASLRRIVVRASGAGEVAEGEAAELQLVIEQRGWWPVFMVEVETQWMWAGKTIVLRHTVPMLRKGRALDLGSRMRFPCRGDYRLRQVRLASAFPLGLFAARRDMLLTQAGFLVLPRPSAVELPDDLLVSSDEVGMQVTRRVGQSNELGALREYEVGDPIGRIHWRASARTGHLVIQHYLQSGSPLIRLVTEIPDAEHVGVENAPAENAVRASAGVCRQANAAGIRLRAYLPGLPEPLTRLDDTLRALARAEPVAHSLHDTLWHAARDLRDGEQLVVVAGAPCDARALVAELNACAVPAGQVIVCIALGQSALASAPAVEVLPGTQALHDAGYRLLAVCR